jgi:hypothetical protein
MRREERKALRVRGWITGMGRTRHECFVQDISMGGAKIVIERGHPPDEFELYFSPHGPNSRKCKVRWRKKNAVGVAFIRETPAEAFNSGMPRSLPVS